MHCNLLFDKYIGIKMKCWCVLSALHLSSFIGVNGNRCIESSTLLEKYRIGKVIGDGNFAVVKECMDR